MRTVTSTTAMTYEQMFKNKDRIRSMLANKPHMETGGTLNDQGDKAFRARVNVLLKENGIEGNVAFGRVEGNITLGVDANGKHIVTSSHSDKAKIESLLNSDEQLKQIKNDPAKQASGGKRSLRGDNEPCRTTIAAPTAPPPCAVIPRFIQ